MQSRLRGLSVAIGITILLISSVIVAAPIDGFGDFSQFTVNGTALELTDGIELTNSASSESRSIFYNTPETISNFTASFTYKEVGTNTGSGATFVLQNTDPGVNATGSGTQYGYAFLGAGYGFHLYQSAAISLELTPNGTSTNLYTSGQVEGGTNPTGPVNLLSGDSIGVVLTYNGTTLMETLTDGSVSQTYKYPVNLSPILGGQTAFVGFTAGTPVFPSGDAQYISDFKFTSVPEPSSLLLTAVGAILVIGLAGRHRKAKLG